METTTESKEVVFSIYKMLNLIKEDTTLTNVLKNKSEIPSQMLYTMAKSGVLEGDTVQYIKEMFIKIVLQQKHMLDRYVNVEGEQITETIEIEDLPKKYGKKKILTDIEEQGGNATEVQRMMLESFKLINIFQKLSRRGISDMLAGTNNLSDDDCRTVIATIKILENKTKNIL
jgi:hypothetical protein